MTASWPRLLGLAVAGALLVAVLVTADLDEAARLVATIGWGALAVLALSALVPVIDTITWALALESGGWTARRSLHLFNARLIGEAFNAVLPAAGFGGEPVKAVLLARRLGVGYHQGSASIVLARVVNMLALIPFLIVGVALISTLPSLPTGFAWLAAGGVVWFALATLILFAITRFPLSSGFAAWLAGHRFGRGAGRLIGHLGEVELRFRGFYAEHRARFLAAVGLSIVQWIIGALEVWLILALLGRPVSLPEAWLIESVAQVVRAAGFLIPSGLGAQEGALLLVVRLLTGPDGAGLALAVVRRLRELVWIVAGLVLALAYGVAPGKARRNRA